MFIPISNHNIQLMKQPANDFIQKKQPIKCILVQIHRLVSRQFSIHNLQMSHIPRQIIQVSRQTSIKDLLIQTSWPFNDLQTSQISRQILRV